MNLVTYFAGVCVDGGNGYLESEFCWKVPYHVQSFCPQGLGGGGPAKEGQEEEQWMDDEETLR